MEPDVQEIAHLRQFLWEHTAPSEHTSAGSAGRPLDNVRQLGRRSSPAFEVE